MGHDEVPDYLRGVTQSDMNDQHPKRKVTPPPAAMREVGLGGPPAETEKGSGILVMLLNIFLIGGTFALVVFVGIGGTLGYGAYSIGGAELEARSKGTELVALVEGSEGIARDLMKRGAGPEILSVYERFDSAEGHEKFAAAYAFAGAAEGAVVQVGLMGGSTADQTARLRRPADAYQAAHANWEASAATVPGVATCMLGLASCPEHTL